MNKVLTSIFLSFLLLIFTFSSCNTSSPGENTKDSTQVAATNSFGAFNSQVEWGAHLVKVAGCNDCHTPKKMGPNGPEDDMSLMLSGHPAQQPPPAQGARGVIKSGCGLGSRNWGQECPQNPQAGKPALRVAQTFLSAGSGDFPVARPSPTSNHALERPIEGLVLFSRAFFGRLPTRIKSPFLYAD